MDTSRNQQLLRGTSEEYLGKIGWQERGLSVATKVYPTIVSPFPDFTPDRVVASVVLPLVAGVPYGPEGICD